MNLREGIRSAPVRPYRGIAYRHIGEAYADRPLSGTGSYQRGGRFNPAGSFPVLYLCTTYRCATEEFRRRIEIVGADPGDLLPRVVYEYEVNLGAVLDLTDDATLRHLRLSVGKLTSSDRLLTRKIGDYANKSGLYQAILSFSATGVDEVLAVMEEGLMGVSVIASRRWSSPADI